MFSARRVYGRTAPLRQLTISRDQVIDHHSKLTDGRLLARNSVLNLAGQAAPMLVALVAIPLLVHGLGTERFGVLTLVWMAVGYLSLFDFGLGRALTQLVAERLGSERADELPGLVGIALVLMLLLGTVGGLAVAAGAPWLVHRLLTVPGRLQDEALQSFRVLALALPWVVGAAGLRGVLEAAQRFSTINWVRIPLGVFTFAGPLLVLPFSRSLVPVVAVLAAGRLGAWVAYLVLCLRSIPELRAWRSSRTNSVGVLLRFGGWMTVSNIVSPIMVYFDRFLIGSLLSVTAVAYYSMPYELVTRLGLVPSALLGVLFPAFAATNVHGADRLGELLDRAIRVIFVLLFPAVLLAVTLAHEGLALWVGPVFGVRSAPVLQWLAVGVLVNSIAQVPFSALQSVGRPDLTGKLHLLELPLYLALLWWATVHWGIAGTAVAWVFRMSLDLVLLLSALRSASTTGGAVTRRVATLMVPAVLALAAGASLAGLATRLAFLCVATAAFVVWGWLGILDPSERHQVARLFAAVRERVTSRGLRETTS